MNGPIALIQFPSKWAKRIEYQRSFMIAIPQLDAGDWRLNECLATKAWYGKYVVL